MVDFKQILTEDNTEPNTAFLNQLRNKLPEFFTKDKYDIDKDGRQVLVEAGEFDIQKFQDSLLKHNVNEITDGYTLNFVGKKYAELQTGKPTTTVVIPDVKHNDQSKNAQSENIFLTGDNLDVLKHLQRAYTNSIDMIYIDPPYNTGSDGFVYNDKFDLSDEDLRDTFNMSEDEIKRLHLLNGRSSHSAWLTFMYPRLKIAQQLLKDTGVVFVSIDDNEQANLKLLMDDVFGEGGFVGSLVHQRAKGGGQAKYIVKGHDIINVYAKSIANFEPLTKPKVIQGKIIEKNGIQYLKNDDIYRKQFGKYEAGTERRLYYEDALEIKGEKVKDGIDRRLSDGEIFLEARDNGKHVMYDLTPVADATSKLYSIIKVLSAEGKSRLEELHLDDYFSYPKPVNLIKQLLQTRVDKHLTVLDFFAGSSTTADAVMQLNAEDGGNRKWILNTLDEKTPDDSAAHKDGYLTIDEISRERIKRAGEKIKKEHPKLDSFDAGFKHYYVKEMDAETVDTIVTFDPNNLQWLTDDVVSEFSGQELTLGQYYEESDKDKENPKFANTVNVGATGEDTILQTWLINDGYKFDVPVKTIELVHHKVHYVEDGAMAYIINQFTQEDVEALLNAIGTQQLNVKTIIVFGYSFDFATMTSLKNNVKTTLDGVRVEVRY